MSNSSGAPEHLASEHVPLEQYSTESAADDLADDAASAPRTGNCNGPRAWVPPSIVGAALGFQARWQWRAACDVQVTIKHIRKPLLPGTSTDQWWRNTAADILQKAGPGGNRGALGQLRGHLFESCDIRDYNFYRAGAYRLVQLRKPFNRYFDAIRLDANGKFAGAVQHKLGPAGIPTAINKLEAYKPGLAKKVTFRVPKDRFKVCKQAAKGRISVKKSRLTSKSIGRIADCGLRELAAHGEAAMSLRRQVGRAAAKSGVVSVAVGALVDLHALSGGNLNARQFGARRGIDAAQAGITAAAAATTIADVTARATCLASAAPAGTLAAKVVGRVAASTVVSPAVVALVVGYGVSRAASPVRRYVTDRLHSPANDEANASVLREAARGRGGDQPSG